MFANRLSILIIECPPQHGKSAIVSQWAPAWFEALYPERNVGLASYEAGVAVRWGRWVRDTSVEHGTVEVKQDSQAAEEWNTEAGGGMKSVGGTRCSRLAYFESRATPITWIATLRSSPLRN